MKDKIMYIHGDVTDNQSGIQSPFCLFANACGVLDNQELETDTSVLILVNYNFRKIIFIKDLFPTSRAVSCAIKIRSVAHFCRLLLDDNLDFGSHLMSINIIKEFGLDLMLNAESCNVPFEVCLPLENELRESIEMIKHIPELSIDTNELMQYDAVQIKFPEHSLIKVH